jgi:hypothetical protein
METHVFLFLVQRGQGGLWCSQKTGCAGCTVSLVGQVMRTGGGAEVMVVVVFVCGGECVVVCVWWRVCGGVCVVASVCVCVGGG